MCIDDASIVRNGLRMIANLVDSSICSQRVERGCEVARCSNTYDVCKDEDGERCIHA